ncbi:MAG: type I-E CRISPR-associated protein Cas5/CasD [Gammaproteobacteria bacterium]|nr:type I-E CRISPR-associated protein Cas5/CasD [Gammaproteobacteria bacterium]
MPTLLLRLAGPMQSWGTTSRFDQRDTSKEPSKSGVIGLLAAALGIDREVWNDELKSLAALTMAVRHDRPGVLKRDYQTAGCAAADKMRRANGSLSDDGVTSQRHYLADAVFLVGLEGADRNLLERAHAALQNPVWLLALGRKSYVPSEPVWLDNSVVDAPLLEALAAKPWIATPRRWESAPERLLVSIESQDGSGALRMDQPLSSFAERRFGARYVRSKWMALPQEDINAPV